MLTIEAAAQITNPDSFEVWFQQSPHRRQLEQWMTRKEMESLRLMAQLAYLAGQNSGLAMASEITAKAFAADDSFLPVDKSELLKGK